MLGLTCLCSSVPCLQGLLRSLHYLFGQCLVVRCSCALRSVAEHVQGLGRCFGQGYVIPDGGLKGLGWEVLPDGIRYVPVQDLPAIILGNEYSANVEPFVQPLPYPLYYFLELGEALESEVVSL